MRGRSISFDVLFSAAALDSYGPARYIVHLSPAEHQTDVDDKITARAGQRRRIDRDVTRRTTEQFHKAYSRPEIWGFLEANGRDRVPQTTLKR